MSTNSASKNELLDRLIPFEQQLAVPVISGELEVWLTEVNEAAESLEEFLRQQFSARHESLFREIGENDPALLTRIDKLREEDGELLGQFHEWRLRLQRLVDNKEELEPAEKIRDTVLPKMIEQGLELVMAFRKQEVQIVTWLNEALMRERGDAD